MSVGVFNGHQRTKVGFHHTAISRQTRVGSVVHCSCTTSGVHLGCIRMRNLSRYFHPRSKLRGDVDVGVVLIVFFIGGLQDTALVVRPQRHIVARFLATATNASVINLRERSFIQFVPPVGVSVIAIFKGAIRFVEEHRLVVGAVNIFLCILVNQRVKVVSATATVLISNVNHLEIVKRINVVHFNSRTLPVSRSRELNRWSRVEFTLFGGDKNNTISSSSTIDGSRGRVFEHRNRLDVVGVH